MSTPLITFSRRLHKTPFTERILAGGAKSMTVYNHTLLPSWFKSLEDDYWHLVENVQVWDVSCERQVQIQGPDATRLVQWMTPRDLSKAQDDQCFYVPLCDQDGRIMNDPIAIWHGDDTWWLSIADSDIYLWARGLAFGKGLNVEITRAEVWPVAVQGPKAETLMVRLFGEDIKSIRFFRYKRLQWNDHEFIVARSGWSGQGGFEIYVDNIELGLALWDELFARGEDINVGHGCPNNIERMETGLLSFGSDMDYSHTPLQCGLDKYCALDSDIESMSLPALRAQRDAGIPSRLMGLVVADVPTVSHNAELVVEGRTVGEITSQSMSARYDAWLGYAMLDTHLIDNIDSGSVQLHLRSNEELYAVSMCELPFKFNEMDIRERPGK